MIVRLFAAVAAVMTLGAWSVHAPPPPPVTLYDQPFLRFDPPYIMLPVPTTLMIGPGWYYGQLAVIPANARLPVVLCEYRSGWCQVRYGRYNGWVFDPPRRRRHFEDWWPFGH